MKLILAIVHNDDAAVVTSELSKAGFFSTKIASTGGFLSAGNTTFITGVEDEKAQDVIRIITKNGKKREQYVSANALPGLAGMAIHTPMKVETGGATIFVLDVEKFIHI